MPLKLDREIGRAFGKMIQILDYDFGSARHGHRSGARFNPGYDRRRAFKLRTRAVLICGNYSGPSLIVIVAILVWLRL